MLKCKIYKPDRSGAGCSGILSSLHQKGLACRSYIFTPILNFSSEMESGNISLPLIACQEGKSKILKILITLTYIHISISIYNILNTYTFLCISGWLCGWFYHKHGRKSKPNMKMEPTGRENSTNTTNRATVLLAKVLLIQLPLSML